MLKIYTLTFSGVLFSLVEAKDCSVLCARATTAAASCCCWWCCVALKPSKGLTATGVGAALGGGSAVVVGAVVADDVLEVGEWAMAAALTDTDVGGSLLCSVLVAKTSKSLK